MDSVITLQRFFSGVWIDIASVELRGDVALGIAAPTATAYVIDYCLENLDRCDAAALSAQLPVELGQVRRSRWPGFLVDLLPQGYGRAELLRELNLPEAAGRPADWLLLRTGAGNPIGHLRVKEAHDWLCTRCPPVPSEGFTVEEVAARSDDFVEFLARHGLFVAGSSGVQGEWPKLLLTEGHDGRLHLDHVLPDERARAHWLVKFGRGPDPALARILDLEAPYMRVARRLGARVYGELVLRHRALFIPRFDRCVGTDGVERIAQESIASLCGLAEFGSAPPHDAVVQTLARVVTDPEAEVVEYVRRDVLNVVFGNRDNHARNTAVQRFEDGTIRLAPLFDFAPMMLHPDGIARRSRWRNEVAGTPDWAAVIDQCREATELPLPTLPAALRAVAAALDELPRIAQEEGVTPDILDRQRLAIGAARASLSAL